MGCVRSLGKPGCDEFLCGLEQLMGRTHNGIDYDAPEPPPVVFVVLRDRLRAGRGILKINAHRWVPAANRPMAISGSSRQEPGQMGMYALMDCFLELREAVAVARIRLANELAYERMRMRVTVTRLREARDALAKQEEGLMIEPNDPASSSGGPEV